MKSALVAGVAGLIAVDGLGVWSPTGVYPSGVWGIYDSNVPMQAERLITLTPYDVDNDPSLSDSVLGLQIRTRVDGMDPRPARDHLGLLFDLLHGATHLELPGVTVIQLLWQSSAELGRDVNNRWSYADTYYAWVHRPSRNRQ